MFSKIFFCLLSVSLTLANPQDGNLKSCNQGLGKCVPFTQCSNSTEFNDGSSQFQVRFFMDTEESQNCHYLEYCCDPEDILTPEEFEEIPIKFTLNVTEKSKLEPKTGDDDYENENTGHDLNALNQVKPSIRVPRSDGECNDDTHACIHTGTCIDEQSYDGTGQIQSRFTIDHPEHGKCEKNSYVCCEKKNSLYHIVPTSCGIHFEKGVGVHVKNIASESQFGEFPWVAAIMEKTDYDEDYKYFCSGSLIHPQVVLTAAHCIRKKNLNNIKVRLGEWDTQTTTEILPHQEREIQSVDINPYFNENNLQNDFALIVLTQPVHLEAHINTICLPPKHANFNDDKCIVAGWGKDNFNSQSYRANLKRVEVPVVSSIECQDMLRKTSLGERFKLDQSFTCAGGQKDIDACQGDGGAPLVCPHEGKFYQSGIVSWGMQCGQENVPGVYANVVKAREWIDEKMVDYGYGIDSYNPK